MATTLEFKGARTRAFTIKIPETERRYVIDPASFDEGVPKLFEMEDVDAAWLLAYDRENGVGNWVRYEAAPAEFRVEVQGVPDDTPSKKRREKQD